MKRIAFVIALVSLLAGCAPQASTGSSTPPSVEKIVFMAGFKPQANLPFVAAYVAKERGLFREQGLDVDIQHSAGQGEHLRLVSAGQVAVTTATGQDVLKLAADPGLPLVAIAQFGQRSDQALIVKADSPIKSPKDFEGKTVGYKVFPAPEYLAILRSAGVDRSKINEVSVGFDPRILIAGQVDVLPVFRSNEPNILRKLGQEVRIFGPEDFNVPTLGLTYATSRPTLESNRPMLVRFLKATLAATDWIAKNPEQAIDIVMKYAPGEDRDHQLSMLKVELESAQSPTVQRDGPLAMSLDRWREVDGLMVQLNAVTKAVEVEKFADDSLRREALGLK